MSEVFSDCMIPHISWQLLQQITNLHQKFGLFHLERVICIAAFLTNFWPFQPRRSFWTLRLTWSLRSALGSVSVCWKPSCSQTMIILLASCRISQSLKCLVHHMKFLLATTFVRMNLQCSSFEGHLYLIQSSILIHQQHVIEVADHGVMQTQTNIGINAAWDVWALFPGNPMMQSCFVFYLLSAWKHIDAWTLEIITTWHSKIVRYSIAV